MPCIYCFRKKENNQIVYIGSTIQKLNIREAAHRCNYFKNDPNPFYKYMRENGGFDSYEVVEMNNITTDLVSLRRLEREAIVKYNPIGNSTLPSRTREEKLKQQLENSTKDYTECGCGGSYHHGHRMRHYKTRRHIDYQTLINKILTE